MTLAYLSFLSCQSHVRTCFSPPEHLAHVLSARIFNTNAEHCCRWTQYTASFLPRDLVLLGSVTILLNIQLPSLKAAEHWRQTDLNEHRSSYMGTTTVEDSHISAVLWYGNVSNQPRSRHSYPSLDPTLSDKCDMNATP
jgi:hypothetical protein